MPLRKDILLMLLRSFLESKGIKNYLVEIGGELKANGVNSENKIWLIGIDKPTENTEIDEGYQIILTFKELLISNIR